MMTSIAEKDLAELIHKYSLAWMNDRKGNGFAHYAGKLVSEMVGTLKLFEVKPSLVVETPSPAIEALGTEPPPIPPFKHRHRVIRRLTYQCQSPQCQRRMRLFFFVDEGLPKWLNCDFCKAGRGLQIADMESRKQGMAGLPETLITIEHFEDGREEVRKEDVPDQQPSTPGIKKVEKIQRES